MSLDKSLAKRVTMLRFIRRRQDPWDGRDIEQKVTREEKGEERPKTAMEGERKYLQK